MADDQVCLLTPIVVILIVAVVADASSMMLHWLASRTR
jgi:hypothetical protein